MINGCRISQILTEANINYVRQMPNKTPKNTQEK